MRTCTPHKPPLRPEHPMHKPSNFYDNTKAYKNTGRGRAATLLDLPDTPPLNLYKQPFWTYEKDLEVLRLIKQGWSYTETAEKLSVLFNTPITLRMIASRVYAMRGKRR